MASMLLGSLLTQMCKRQNRPSAMDPLTTAVTHTPSTSIATQYRITAITLQHNAISSAVPGTGRAQHFIFTHPFTSSHLSKVKFHVKLVATVTLTKASMDVTTQKALDMFKMSV